MRTTQLRTLPCAATLPGWGGGVGAWGGGGWGGLDAVLYTAQAVVSAVRHQLARTVGCSAGCLRGEQFPEQQPHALAVVPHRHVSTVQLQGMQLQVGAHVCRQERRPSIRILQPPALNLVSLPPKPFELIKGYDAPAGARHAGVGMTRVARAPRAGGHMPRCPAAVPAWSNSRAAGPAWQRLQDRQESGADQLGGIRSWVPRMLRAGAEQEREPASALQQGIYQLIVHGDAAPNKQPSARAACALNRQLVQVHNS